jgi:four helix bundle protein
MLIGLRKSWLQNSVSEEPGDYHTEGSSLESQNLNLFHHESLDLYQVGLDFMRWFISLPGGRELSDRLYREVDKAATSVLLNVAEGNGRYSELDHRRFLEVAEASAVRAAVYLDLCGLKALPAQMETSHGGKLLIRISAMLNKL